MTVTANEIKTKGVSLLAKLLQKADEVIINVRGKNRYVVLDIERYEAFRQSELDLAYLQMKQEIEAGRYKEQSAEAHLREFKDAL